MFVLRAGSHRFAEAVWDRYPSRFALRNSARKDALNAAPRTCPGSFCNLAGRIALGSEPVSGITATAKGRCLKLVPQISSSFVAAALAVTTSAARAPFNHVVIVIEENHGFTQVIGDPAAPYINSLASSGALFTSFYGLTHPSQPNYLHFFSGSNQGVFDNNVPAGIPFSTANLGSALASAGATFVGFSEDLPAPGSEVAGSGAYVRRHNPWVNWQSDTPGPNQLPPSANQPFTAFPADFALLPSVSIVVPNLINDMHDGTIAQADAWLVSHIKPYADWAVTHNSLLIVAWDEDGFAQRNRIPTIFYGASVVPGESEVTGTLHNLLRTVGDMFGAAPSGAAARVRPVVGAFESDPHAATVRFQRGLPGADVKDTYIDSAAPGSPRTAISPIVVDGSPSNIQGLVRFDSIFGRAPGMVPPGAKILSAKLLLLTGTGASDSSADEVRLHRILRPWAEADTWNSLGAGMSTDDTEASSSFEFAAISNVLDAWAICDVSDSVQAMTLDPASNHGWLLLPTGPDGWRFKSSESAIAGDRPMLEVTFVSPVCAGDLSGDGLVDDSDFVLFVAAYDLFESPPASSFADFNADGSVDNPDFAMFATAYDALLCP